MAKNDDSRTRQSIPISGLDTSAPDLTVADGKCEVLHNLRWAAGAWHDVKPLDIKFQIDISDPDSQLPRSLTIIYHHPAAGDDVYIASIPNDDDTISLCRVAAKDGAFVLHPEGINPLYVYRRLAISPTGGRTNLISVVSIKPVATDISVTIFYKKSPLDPTIYTRTLTILKGKTTSGNITGALFIENENTKPTPELDDMYSYPLFRTKDEALVASGFFATNILPDVKISHFGTALILIQQEKTPLYFLLDNNKYDLFRTEGLSIKLSIDTNNRVIQPNTTATEEIIAGGVNGTVHNTKQYTKLCDLTGTTIYYRQHNGDYWSGEICLFATLRMDDGTVVSQTPPYIIASELKRQYKMDEQPIDDKYCNNYYVVKKFNGEPIFCLKSRFAFNKQLRFTTNNFMFAPIVNIQTGDFKLNAYKHIKDVAIYATRINPTFDYGKLVSEYRNWELAGRRYDETKDPEAFSGSTNLDTIFAENKLLEQPFYLIKTIPKDELINNEISIKLNSELLENAEANTEYEPNQYAHTLSFTGIKEYNSRIHFFDINTQYSKGYDPVLPYEHTSEPSDADSLITEIKKDSRILSIVRCEDKMFTKDIVSLVVYPDANATNIRIACKSGNNTFNIYRTLVLHESRHLNIAYYITPREILDFGQIDSEAGGSTTRGAKTCYVKYPATTIPDNPTDINISVDIIDSYRQPNRLQTSGVNNLFNIPYSNSYAIGTESNRILAVNSAAIEMSDAKFGEFPLYVFTEEGVFAMQSGRGEVLYSATIPLNYDRIINPHTLAINQNVLYITDRGIHALFSNQSKLISEPLNDLQNLPPLEFLRNARMCYQHPFNEVIVWDDSKATDGTYQQNTAFVYSLGGGYWSTRDFEGTKLNTDEIFARKNAGLIFILDLNGETARLGNPSTVRLVTRPIKLGSAEFKRLETFIPRLFAEIPLTVEISFEASVDQKTWIPLRKDCIDTDRDFTLRRFPFSFRYLRISLETIISKNFELTRFDIEYYLRFLHRLR